MHRRPASGLHVNLALAADAEGVGSSRLRGIPTENKQLNPDHVTGRSVPVIRVTCEETVMEADGSRMTSPGTCPVLRGG